MLIWKDFINLLTYITPASKHICNVICSTKTCLLQEVVCLVLHILAFVKEVIFGLIYLLIGLVLKVCLLLIKFINTLIYDFISLFFVLIYVFVNIFLNFINLSFVLISFLVDEIFSLEFCIIDNAWDSLFQTILGHLLNVINICEFIFDFFELAWIKSLSNFVLDITNEVLREFLS